MAQFRSEHKLEKLNTGDKQEKKSSLLRVEFGKRRSKRRKGWAKHSANNKA